MTPMLAMRALRRHGSLVVALFCAGCDWIGLAPGALSYEEVQPGDAANVVAFVSLIFVPGASSIQQPDRVGTLVDDGEVKFADSATSALRGDIRN